MSEHLKIKLMYKIHALNTAMGMSRSAGNNTFYETEDEALAAARSYVDRPGSSAMVVYKAHVLVRKSQPPVEILSLGLDGEVIPLRDWRTEQ